MEIARDFLALINEQIFRMGTERVQIVCFDSNRLRADFCLLIAGSVIHSGRVIFCGVNQAKSGSLDGMTDLEKKGRRTTAWFFSGRKPEYPRRMHCIQGSDAHRITRDPRDPNRLGWGDRVTEIQLPEPSFEAIKAVFLGEDFTRTRPYRPAQAPYDHVQAAREEGSSIVQSFHESMARRRLRNFLVVLEPAVILGMGLLVGFIVFSLFLAIFRLNEVPF